MATHEAGHRRVAESSYKNAISCSASFCRRAQSKITGSNIYHFYDSFFLSFVHTAQNSIIRTRRVSAVIIAISTDECKPRSGPGSHAIIIIVIIVTVLMALSSRVRLVHMT